MRTAAVWSAARKGSRAGSNRGRDAKHVAEPLDDPLQVEEVDVPRATGPVHRRRRSGPGDADGPGFAVGRETGPDLEQPDVLSSVPAVVRHGVDEPRYQRGSERVELGGQRIGERDGPIGAVHGERVGGFRFDESERDRFRQAGCRQDPANEPIARNARIGRRSRRGDDRKGRRQLVEPEVPPDFFDEIDFALQIDAEGRSVDVPAIGGRRDGETQPAQNPLHVAIRYARSPAARSAAAGACGSGSRRAVSGRRR